MIGVRFSLYPTRDDYVPIILGAVEGLDRLGLEVEVDDVSTCLIGEEPRLFEALRVAFGRAARSGAHVSLVATFSAGCPGEPDGDPCLPRQTTVEPMGEEGWIPEAYDLPARVAVQFALYPLGVKHYMDVIYAEIDVAKAGPARTRGQHFCTRLEDDGASAFTTLRTAFHNARKEAAHVVMTVTMTANSPSWQA